MQYMAKNMYKLYLNFKCSLLLGTVAIIMVTYVSILHSTRAGHTVHIDFGMEVWTQSETDPL